MSQYANNQNSGKKLFSPGFKEQVEPRVCIESLQQVCSSSNLKGLGDAGRLS